MVNACECQWTREQVKALITFLIAEKKRHEKDIWRINRSIERLKKEYNITEVEFCKCEELAWLYVEF